MLDAGRGCAHGDQYLWVARAATGGWLPHILPIHALACTIMVQRRISTRMHTGNQCVQTTPHRRTHKSLLINAAAGPGTKECAN
jgi:hypothetical protein